MEYIVRAWVDTGTRPPVTKYHEFADLEEAQKKADYLASEYRKGGYEFDITIYEIINY